MKRISFIFSLILSTCLMSSIWAQNYSKGERVEAFWQGSWYKSTIEAVDKPGFYKVHFDGYWASREELLPQERIRPLPQRTQPDLNSIKSGDAIEFLENDHWKPAIFVELQGKKALIRYADGKEKLIPASHMSQVAKASTAPAK